jgi:thiamine biosynthesis protein ThiI
MSDLPVFRPLIGMDKGEIIKVSNQIGTYETSILPYDDCCTLFSPKHPLVRPDTAALQTNYAQMNIESLLEKALTQVELFAL